MNDAIVKAREAGARAALMMRFPEHQQPQWITSDEIIQEDENEQR